MTAVNAYNGTFELEFERPLLKLEREIEQLETHHADRTAAGSVDLGAEIRKLRQNHTTMLKKIYGKLGPWQTVQVARHPGRPQPIDHIRAFVKDFCELHGDRHFGDDHAIITGFGRIGPHKCLVIAHNKGKETNERIACHFGMAHPEGYRKALLKMKLAEKFGLPVVTFVDTPGAFPGIGAEERGQAEAIAVNLREMSRLRVPIMSVIIGEGGSGGALGIAVADRVAMLQYAWYSVISPEGCSSILWKTGEAAAKAAEALNLTASDNLKHGTIDEAIAEPLGGAHRNPRATSDNLEKWVIQSLRELKRFKIENLVNKRYDRLRRMGQFDEK
ncbi:MAG: acetyl-CoA carboxylase carboxyltransferase subunit alpha [Phycisphaeraceae bacterium]